MEQGFMSHALDTKWVISETFVPANLLARYQKKSNPTKLTQNQSDLN